VEQQQTQGESGSRCDRQRYQLVVGDHDAGDANVVAGKEALKGTRLLG
jgi:hypothetical protein